MGAYSESADDTVMYDPAPATDSSAPDAVLCAMQGQHHGARLHTSRARRTRLLSDDAAGQQDNVWLYAAASRG
eukprot:55312-Eustigmatos_ZCMA.PRE.1